MQRHYFLGLVGLLAMFSVHCGGGDWQGDYGAVVRRQPQTNAQCSSFVPAALPGGLRLRIAPPATPNDSSPTVLMRNGEPVCQVVLGGGDWNLATVQRLDQCDGVIPPGTRFATGFLNGGARARMLSLRWTQASEVATNDRCYVEDQFTLTE